MRVPDTRAGLKPHKLIRKWRRHLFVFVTNRAIEATNNGSKRALRPCAVYRKITNGFRGEWGAALYADIRSVVETAAADPSAPSTPSASPSTESRSLSPSLEPVRGVSNYRELALTPV